MKLVKTEIPVEYVLNDEYKPLKTYWSWIESDPYAVTVDIPQGETLVSWCFAMDLIREGAKGPVVGLGDVKVWADKDYGWLRLENDVGGATFRMPIYKMKKFVYSVPTDFEFEISDADIVKLMESGGSESLS